MSARENAKFIENKISCSSTCSRFFDSSTHQILWKVQVVWNPAKKYIFSQKYLSIIVLEKNANLLLFSDEVTRERNSYSSIYQFFLIQLQMKLLLPFATSLTTSQLIKIQTSSQLRIEFQCNSTFFTKHQSHSQIHWMAKSKVLMKHSCYSIPLKNTPAFSP